MHLRCIKDFIMEDGTRSFTDGENYDFTYVDGFYYATDDQGNSHEMAVEYMINYFYSDDPRAQ